MQKDEIEKYQEARKTQNEKILKKKTRNTMKKNKK